ncbi:MAG: hypothetical protein GX631_08185 [Dehalococcoidales bacterium]|nr:hypothetical protein [Dehalococcoidales bacterium]
MTESEARSRCWFFDSKGLVIKSRQDLPAHKLPYAHEHEPVHDLLSAVASLRPTMIVGAAAQPKAFNRQVIEVMSQMNERPIIFAMSNPTSKSECTAEEAYTWSLGKAVFASGSPFSPVTIDGITHVPGQCNNAYLFPGIGLGVIACAARSVTDEMIFSAAKALADETSGNDIGQGRVFPPLTRIREVSAAIAEAVAETAWEQGMATAPKPADVKVFIREHMYEPEYKNYV